MVSNVSTKLFEDVATRVRNPIAPFKPNLAQKSRTYGLYKRVTEGRLKPPYGDDDKNVDSRPKTRPAMYKVNDRAKYDGWAKADNLSKQEAMDEYVNLIEELLGKEITEMIEKASS